MQFFGFQVSRVRKDTGSIVPQVNSRWWQRILEPYSGAWQRNVECDSRENVLAFAAVYACITRIANDIAKMPLLLVEKSADGIWSVVDRQSPFWPVLRKPNAWQNRIQFIICWLLSKLQTGNAYILKQRDGRGMVVALYVLDPYKVKCHYTASGQVFYALSRDDLSGLAVEVNVPASEIIHDLMNPLFHPLAGVSPLYACGMAATQGNRIQANSAVFFENNSMPSGILSAPGEIPDTEAEKWKAGWTANFSGQNRGKVAILGGGLKYEAISKTAGESQLIEQLRWTAEDVARAFGVPLYKINAGPVPVSNNVEALNAQYYSDTLQSLIEAIELCLDEGLGIGEGSQNPTLGTEFDLDVLLRMDSATKIETLAKGTGAGIYAPNEARRRVNLPPVTGGASPLMQEQNYSLEALAKRDAKPDPFASAPPPAPPPPADDPEPDPEEERAALVTAKAEIARLARAALGLETR